MGGGAGRCSLAAGSRYSVSWTIDLRELIGRASRRLGAGRPVLTGLALATRRACAMAADDVPDDRAGSSGPSAVDAPTHSNK